MSAYCIHGKWSLPADSHLFTSSKQTPSPQVPIIRYDTIRYLNTLNCTCPAATDLPASPASAVWLRILQLYAINWGDHSLVRVAHVVACWLLLCVEHSVRHVSRLLFPLTTIENKLPAPFLLRLDRASSVFVKSWRLLKRLIHPKGNLRLGPYPPYPAVPSGNPSSVDEQAPAGLLSSQKPSIAKISTTATLL